MDKQEGYLAMVTGKTRKGRADNNGVFQTGEGGYEQNQKRCRKMFFLNPSA